MKLNLYIIQYELAGKYSLALAGREPSGERDLAGVLPYTGERCPLGDRLYIARTADLEHVADTSLHPTFLLAGDPQELLSSRESMSVLYTEEDADIFALLSDVSEVFMRYEKWRSDMQAVCARHGQLAELGAVAERMMGNPIHLIDEESRLIFTAIDPSHYTVPENYVWKTEYGDERVVNRMLSMPEYADFPGKQGIFRFDHRDFADLGFSYDALCCNVYADGRFFGSLYSDNLGHDFTPRDTAVLLMIRDVIAGYAASYRARKLDDDPMRDSIIKELLNHGQVEKTMLGMRLRASGWCFRDQYVCVRVECGNSGRADLLYSNLGVNIAASLSACTWVLHRSGLVIVLNVTRMVEPYEYVLEFIGDRVSANDMIAGVSDVFSDFYNLVYAHRHAERAIELSAGKRGGSALCFFEDVKLEYIMSKCLENDPLEAVCPPGLMQLLKADREKGTNNIAVLRAYLENNMNAAETARAFFVHRNTMIYRVQQIERVLNMDLTDPKNRLLLSWSIELIEFSGGYSSV